MSADSPSPVRASAQELQERLNIFASEGCDGIYDDEPCFRARPDMPMEWCPHCAAQEAAKLIAAEARGRQQAEQFEKNGIRVAERVVCIDVPRLIGTVTRCTEDDVRVRWDDGKTGDLIWDDSVAYNAYRLQIVRGVQAEQARDEFTPHMAAGLLMQLKLEAEKQHDRAEAAESRVAALTQALKDARRYVVASIPSLVTPENGEAMVAKIDAALTGAQAFE